MPRGIRRGTSTRNKNWTIFSLERRIMLAGDVGVATESAAPITAATVLTASPVAGTTTHLAVGNTRGVVFVSPDAPELERIAAGLHGGHDFILLDSSRNGLEQITAHLAARSDLSSVHIITHGDDGRILLGNQQITSASLQEFQSELRGWSNSLADDADILLYGCDVAATVAGRDFVQQLAALTGADVAASTDMTGNKRLGGDWDLEFTVGAIESPLAINDFTRRSYGAVLPITIRAAGTTNDEQMLVQIDGTTVATFDNVGGDANGGVFETYNYNVDGISANDVRVVFTNDLYDPVNGVDRNLRVDSITIDGVTYQTEHPTVYSTGTWQPEDGIVPGFRESEILHTSGYFQYAEILPNNGSVVEIRANGTEGPENMELRIDGALVQSWSNIGTTPQTYAFTTDGTVTASQVQVGFTNDVWDPVNGIDNNLVVDWIAIDGQTFQTEDPSVFSTGSWLPEDGIVPGFRQSEVLNANGYFQYADGVSNDGSVIVVHASGFEGDEDMALQIDGATVATWGAVGTNQQAFAYTATSTVTADQIRVAFTNDLWDPGNGIDRNLIVDRITVDGVNYETEDPSVYSTGTWLPEDGIVPGFRESEILSTNGYFQYAVIPTIEPGSLSFANTTEAISESITTLSLTVTRNGGSDGEVTVQYDTVDGTALDGQDYTAASGILTFADGETSKTIVVTLLPDVDDETDEDFSVVLSNATAGATLAADTAVVTILDDDVPLPGTLAISPIAPSIDESATDITLTVTRTGGSDGEVTVQYDTVDGTALDGEDYTAASGILTFADGETSKTIVVALLPDVDDETDEDFSVVLSNATAGATLAADTAVVTILDDDVPLPGTLAISPIAPLIDESATDITLTVTRTGGSDGEVTVQYDTVDGTALDGEDYTAASGILTFADGETSKTIVVALLPDVDDETDEDFSVVLSNATAGATLAADTAVVTILDDDVPLPGTLAISPIVSVVDESATQTSFVVTRSGGSDGEITVQYDTSDGSAVAGEDYTAASGILTFADGETSKTITVDLTGDNVDEPDQGFLLTLSNVTGGAALADSVATATIVDDDQATLGGSPIFARDGHLYLLTTSAASWSDAQLEAESVGGNLVTISDVAEEDWLKQTFGAQPYWIGLQENPTTGQFQWVSTEPVTYTNWAPGQPNDPAVDNVAVMNSPATGQWSDEVGAGPELGIIEIGSNAVDPGPIVPNGTGFITETIASGLSQPIAFAEAPDGRIFVNEKAGRVRVIENGQLLETPFLDINLEVNSHHDRGLMGIALDPDFDTNGYVYLQYAVELNPGNPDEPDFNTPAAGQLIRVTASTADPNVADPNSRVVIQDGHQMSHATHAVGDIDFDNAGNLIYTWGDGGFDPVLRQSAQDPTSPQGKLFRIDRTTFEGISANPYYDSSDPSSIESRVWAVGIRNSWKLTVDRATGDVYMGEVTDSGPEEINVMRADGSTILNFGWPYYEDTNRTGYGTVPPGFVYESAFVALPHTEAGGGDAIVGGAVFRGNAYPDVYDGRYFFGNFNQGILYTADQSGNYQQFGDAGTYAGAVDVQLASDGNIWIMSLFTGTIERLVYDSSGSGNTAPNAVASATQTAGEGPIVVTLDASASADDDGDTLLYAWDFESDGVVDATGPVTTRAYAVTGRTTTTLIVSDGNGGTDRTVVEIDVLAAVPNDGNLALGRPAVQSDTDGSALASRAVDGNPSGLFTDDSVAQTVQTRTPLWEVDLGAVYDIGSLEIFTRNDGVNQLNNFWVLISENPFSSGNLNAAQNDPGIWLYHDAGTADPLEIITIGTLGRYVRIQMEGVDDILALAEVKVLAAVTG